MIIKPPSSEIKITRLKWRDTALIQKNISISFTDAPLESFKTNQRSKIDARSIDSILDSPQLTGKPGKRK